MSDHKHSTQPILILVRGLPGSGKTYLSMELKKALGQDVVLLDPDATDYESIEYTKHVEQATKEGVDPKLHAYRFLRAQAYTAIAERKVIIWNQPFTNLDIFNKMVTNLRNQATKHKTTLVVLVVEVEVDVSVARERVFKRKKQGGHGPSEDTFERFVRDYKSFANDGYNTVMINGEDAPSASVEKIMHSLEEL